MKHPNDIVQMAMVLTICDPDEGNYYIIRCLDDCSRKVASRWSERKRSVDVLSVLEDGKMTNGKPKTVPHYNGKQFTSDINQTFRCTQSHRGRSNSANSCIE